MPKEHQVINKVTINSKIVQDPNNNTTLKFNIQDQIKEVSKAIECENYTASHNDWSSHNQQVQENFQFRSSEQYQNQQKQQSNSQYNNSNPNNDSKSLQEQYSEQFSAEDFINSQGQQFNQQIEEEIFNFQDSNQQLKLNDNILMNNKIEEVSELQTFQTKQDDKKLIQEQIRKRIKQKLLQRLLVKKQQAPSNQIVKNKRGRKNLTNNEKFKSDSFGTRIQIQSYKQTYQNNSLSENEKPRKPRKTMTLEDIQNMKRDFENYEYSGKKFTLMELARKYDCIKSTIRKHFRGWKEDPSMRKFVDKVTRANSQQKSKDPKSAWKLINMNAKTLARFKIVRQILRQNPFYTQRQLGLALREIQKKPTGDENSYIKRVLQICGFYRKKHYTVGPQRNSEDKIEARRKFCERYMKYKQLDYEIYHINIEEELFYPHMFRDFFWVHTDDPADLRLLPYAKNVVGMIGITGANGYFDFELKNNGFSYVDENTSEEENSLEFVKAVSEMFEKLPKHKNKQRIFISSTEKDIELQRKRLTMLKQLCNMKGYHLDQIPEDSHQLNPIWFVVKDGKQAMRKLDMTSNEGLIKSAVEVFTTKIGDEKVMKIYQDLNYYLKRGLERQIF